MFNWGYLWLEYNPDTNCSEHSQSRHRDLWRAGIRSLLLVFAFISSHRILFKTMVTLVFSSHTTWWPVLFSPFKPYFFLFFFLILCVLRLNFLKFFLNFWCSKAIFSYFFKYFMEICYPGLENWPRIVKILPILYYYAFLVYFWPKTYTI